MQRDQSASAEKIAEAREVAELMIPTIAKVILVGRQHGVLSDDHSLNPLSQLQIERGLWAMFNEFAKGALESFKED